MFFVTSPRLRGPSSLQRMQTAPGVKVLFISGQQDEIEKILGKEDAIVAARVFGITPAGNYQDAGTGTGQNILYLKKSIAEVASSYWYIQKPILKSGLNPSGPDFLPHENMRSRPSLDDKILTDWNGLFIAALAQAARTFGNEHYLAAARRAMQFVLTRMRDSRRWAPAPVSRR